MTPRRAGLTAAARLSVAPAAGRQRLRWNQAWPVVLRPTGDDRVHLVHGAGGPLGGDEFTLDVEVAAGAGLRVRSAGVTLVQPGVEPTAGDRVGPARWTVAADVGAAGWLDWAPEATVVCAGSAIDSRLRVRLAGSATAVLRELVVLGRHGERGGRYRGELLVDVDGVPLLAHTTLLDGADPVLGGPGGSAGARAVGTLVLAGEAGESDGPRAAGADGRPASAARAVSGVHPSPAGVDGPGDVASGEAAGVRWASSDLEGPGRILIAVGDPGRVIAVLDAYSARWSPQPAVPAVPVPA